MEAIEKTELSILSEISRISNSYVELPEKLRLIVEVVARGMGRDGASVFLVDPSGKTITLAAAVGLNQESVGTMNFPLGMGIAGWVAEQKVPLALEDPYTDPRFQYVPESGIERFKSLAAAPIMDEDRCIGVIFALSLPVWSPSSSDLTLLKTTANQLSGVIKSTQLFQRTQDLAAEARARAQELSILYDIGTAMSTTLNLDRLLRIILTAATMGGSGLGFNRAILLLTNDRTHTLQGMMGIGPTSWEEADRDWSEVAIRHKSLMEWIQTGELFERRDSALNNLAKGIRVSLDDSASVLTLTVLNKRSYNITNASAEPVVPRWLRDTLRVQSFATVPLVAKDRVIGVILVDNMFNQRPITDGDMRFLAMFAHQAALAIENAVIHSNLETMNRDMRIMHEQLVQSEKMAALGAMMAEITHEIRNPLVSIGGFTRRLARNLKSDEDRKYIEIILSEVARLEGIIHDNLSYIKETTPRLEKGDLNAALRDILTLYEDELEQRGIRTETDLSPALPQIAFDGPQIKQAIINVMKNAMEAMETGGTLGVRTYVAAGNGEIAIEISDTGTGISAKAMHNIFNPYYTTKPRGTGLGLPITNRIVKAHGGKIEIRKKEQGGTIFTIILPYQNDAVADRRTIG
jgi:signal transduction histidine kinase